MTDFCVTVIKMAEFYICHKYKTLITCWFLLVIPKNAI